MSRSKPRHVDPTRRVLVPLTLVHLVALGVAWRYQLPLFPAHMVSINLLAFGAILLDKRWAKAGAVRIPEAVLLGLVAVGGLIGCLAGRRHARHKTRKVSFRVKLWALVIAEGLALYWWFWR